MIVRFPAASPVAANSLADAFRAVCVPALLAGFHANYLRALGRALRAEFLIPLIAAVACCGGIFPSVRRAARGLAAHDARGGVSGTLSLRAGFFCSFDNGTRFA